MSLPRLNPLDVTPVEIARTRRMLKQGFTLDQAAAINKVQRDTLDIALWIWMGVKPIQRPEPMFR